MKRLASDLGVGDRIAFLGEVRDVPALLARARMFVLPSRSEGIPLTALEAMACGLPVVATRVGGLPEVVDHGVTGLLVPPADSAALSRRWSTIWDDLDRGDRMGRAGRHRTEERFDVRRMVAQYEALYRAGPGDNRWLDADATAASTMPEPAESSAMRVNPACPRSLDVVIVASELPYPPTAGNRIRTLNLALRLARTHRITLIAHRNDEASEASRFLREHGIETVLVDWVMPGKSGPRFYARLAANLASPVPYSVASHNSPALRRAVHSHAQRHRIDVWQVEAIMLVDALADLEASPQGHHRP